MNHKTWLTVFGVIALLLVGGAGFYAFSAYTKYSDALSSWDDRVRTIESLERKVPYPNEENEEALRENVEAYEASVEQLYTTLATFQKELNAGLTNTQFQEKVRQRVQDFRALAETEEVSLVEEGDAAFQLGFDSYATEIPPQALVPYLDYELEAIDRLLRELVAAGADSLITFERDPIPGEAGGAERQESSVVHKYPVRLRFEARHDSFQKFINKIANDKEYFYIVRVLKVRNNQTEGAIKLIADDGTELPSFVNPATLEQADYEKLVEWGWGTASEAEVAESARAAGFELNKQDARVLMGQEKLTVFMVVDIARFTKAEEQGEATENDESKSKGRNRQ